MHKIARLLLLQAAALLSFGALAAQTPAPAPAPAPHSAPDPTGVVNQVEVRGNVLPGYGHEFLPDGTWEMWDGDGELVGYGTWEQDEETGDIDYENESDDGGGGQSGKYEWDPSEGVWDRTEASHRDAPPLRLLPPL